MKVVEVFDYDFGELMSKVKRRETLVAVPSFLALTMASEVLKSLAPMTYNSALGEEYQLAIKKKFETGQFIGTACCVFPHYHNMPEMDELVEWYFPEKSNPNEIAKARIRSFSDIFELDVNSLGTRNLFFILDDISSLLMKGVYIKTIKDIANESKYREKIDSITISIRS
jgi:hypothetical protein